MFYTTTGESPLETHLYSVSLKGKVKPVTRIPGTHSVSVSSDGKYIHDHFSSHDIPGRDLLITSTGKTIATLLESPEMLEEMKMTIYMNSWP